MRCFLEKSEKTLGRMYFVDFLSVLYNKECLQENNIRVRISLLLFSYLMLQSLMMVSQMAPMQSIMIR